MTVRTATFGGIKYDIDLCGPIDGCVDVANSTTPTIMICRDLATKSGLETACHEAMHCLWPKTTEDKITRAACDMARFLWRIGYRCEK